MNPGKDKFLNKIIEGFSDDRRKIIEKNEKEISELYEKYNLMEKELEKESQEHIELECRNLKKHFYHMKQNYLDRARFIRRRILIDNSVKKAFQQLKELRGTENYQEYLKKELYRYVENQKSFTIYLLDEDREYLDHIMKSSECNYKVRDLNERKSRGAELGGFYLKYDGGDTIYDSTIDTRLSRLVEYYLNQVLF